MHSQTEITERTMRWPGRGTFASTEMALGFVLLPVRKNFLVIEGSSDKNEQVETCSFFLVLSVVCLRLKTAGFPKDQIGM